MKEPPSIHSGPMADLVQLESSGKLKEAIEALRQTPSYDATYFYNLGILHGKLGQPGLAVAYLEKSNQLKPHDPEITRNLRLAQRKLGDHLTNTGTGTALDPASTALERFSDRIQKDEILGVIGLITVVVSLLWIRAYLRTRNITKAFLRPSGWFGALAFVLTLALYAAYRTGSSSPAAVLVNRELLRSGPGLNFPEISPIDTGVKVRLVGQAMNVNENESWQKVRYKDDQTAWLPLSSLLPL